MKEKQQQVVEQRMKEKDRLTLDMAKMLIYGGTTLRVRKSTEGKRELVEHTITQARTNEKNKAAILELVSYLSTKYQNYQQHGY
jgi:hypothetical protein